MQGCGVRWCGFIRKGSGGRDKGWALVTGVEGCPSDVGMNGGWKGCKIKMGSDSVGWVWWIHCLEVCEGGSTGIYIGSFVFELCNNWRKFVAQHCHIRFRNRFEFMVVGA